ncbi:YxiF family protein [Pantoea agglomerans]|jgi:hypothetical protein
MKERADKINELKYKLQQKKMLEVFFEGDSTKDVVFLNESECKEKVKKAFKLAYENVIKEEMVTDCRHEVVFDSYISKEYKKLFNMHFDEIKKDTINVFFWTSNIYCAAVNGGVLLKNIDKIISETGCSDLVIINAGLTFGLCLLCDEHSLSIAYWNNVNMR